jgi:monofunctional biosynthetic peptidoglycan transglycosylase
MLATTGVVFALISIAIVAALNWVNPPTSAFMLRDDSAKIHFEWVDWAEIGIQTPLAVVASEDQKFAVHTGFDIAAIEDSIEDYQNGRGLRGASTISQQVVKNLFLWNGRSFLRKGIEAYFTVVLELCLSKQRILEIYLNIAEFGPGIYGVKAASEAFFYKSPMDLTRSEAALLATVLPNPKRMSPSNVSDYMRTRQLWVEEHSARLQRQNWLTSISR